MNKDVHGGRRLPVRRRALRVLIAGMLCFAAVAFSPGSAQGVAPEDQLIAQDDSGQADTAASLGLTMEELSKADRVLDAARSMQSRLEDDYSAGFGGLYFDYSPLQIVVNWKNDTGIEVPDFVRDHPYASVQLVAHSYQDLIEAQNEFIDVMSLVADDVKFDSWTDLRINQVEIDIHHSQADRLMSLNLAEYPKISDAVAYLGEASPSSVIKVNIVNDLSQGSADIYGGLVTSDCTSGFVVRNGSNVRRGTTAGHCSNQQSFAGTSSNFVSEWYGMDRDVQIHSFTSAHTLSAKFNYGAGTRNVTGVRSWSAIVIGEAVCKYGKTTGQRCGRIGSKTHRPTYVPNASAAFVKIDPTSSNDIGAGGDSGGPVYTGSTAVGFFSGIGGNTPRYGIAMSATALPTPWYIAQA